MRVERVLVVGVVAVLAAACTSDAPPAVRGRLVPVHRLIDDPPPARLLPGVQWRSYVKLGGEERLAMGASSFQSDVVDGVAPPAGSATWTVSVPERARRGPWLLVRPVVVVGGQPTAWLPAHYVRSATLEPVLRFDPGAAAAADGARLTTTFSATPDLDARDVLSPPITVPRGGVLAAGLGIEELDWTTDACAVEFRVGVIAGEQETILHRTVVDPVRRAEDRRWVDVNVDLSTFAGRTVRLRLATAPADAARPGTSLPVWADPVVLAPSAAERPNVILVSLDTLRAKSVSTYGSPRATTPHLDELVAGAGTVFEQAFTTAPHTLPAHLSAFTSLYVRSLGPMGPLSQLPSDVVTLPERLRAAGYDTGAFTEDGFVVPGVGFRRGFATYRENTSPNLHEPLGQSAKTFRDAIDWLAPRRDRPTFLFAHTYEVHFPYTPAPPYDGAFGSAAELSDETAVELLRYEQEARHLDDELRAFLDAVDALGLGRRTLLVVMADHGEEFLEHGQKRHGLQLYDESIRVPLLMRFPDVVPAGLRVATPVSLVDVAPTILDLVGAPALIGADGESLVPLFHGASLSEHRRAVFSEATSSLRVPIDLLSVHLPGLHCIYRTRSGTSECYDVVADPEERHPVGGDRAGLDVSRSEAIAYWSLRRTAPAPTGPWELVRELSKSDDDARLEKLRALGYVE
jgi:arylsulfatase A-like enzyme